MMGMTVEETKNLFILVTKLYVNFAFHSTRSSLTPVVQRLQFSTI